MGDTLLRAPAGSVIRQGGPYDCWKRACRKPIVGQTTACPARRSDLQRQADRLLDIALTWCSLA